MAVFGAALFFADGMITPAISVLSAMEGLEIVNSGLDKIVVPGALVILLGLFAGQRYGTARVGRMFGPIMVLWFSALALLGVRGVAKHPGVLQALSPHWAIKYLAEEPLTAFLSLGGVVLAVTGAEALYADMGHFGKGPIRRSWFLPGLPRAVSSTTWARGASSWSTTRPEPQTRSSSSCPSGPRFRWSRWPRWPPSSPRRP